MASSEQGIKEDHKDPGSMSSCVREAEWTDVQDGRVLNAQVCDHELVLSRRRAFHLS